MSNLIPSQTGLTLRRTDTLISLTNKLLVKTGVKGISEMSDDELWEWWLGIDDEWKFLLLRGLKLGLWQNNGWEFDGEYDYQADFDWLDRSLTFHYIKKLKTVTKLYYLSDERIQDISLLFNLTHLTKLILYKQQIQDISALTNLIQLTKLNLQYNQVQDISALAHLIQLTGLGLGCNQIQDITPLANLRRLKRLYLEDNPIKPQDIEWLRQQLPNCEIIF